MIRHRDVVRSAFTPLTREGIDRHDMLMILLGRLYLFLIAILVTWVAVIAYMIFLVLVG